MSLANCVQTLGLQNDLKAGLLAMGNYSNKVKIKKPKLASHSIDLDSALKNSLPRDPRWDYGVGVQDGNNHEIVWIEVHHASSSEVSTVLEKLKWLQDLLRSSGMGRNPCNSVPNSFYWVAISGVHIDSQKRRLLAAKGLHGPKSFLQL